MHKEHVIKALNNSKHVIVEKPIALNPKDAKEMFALGRKNLHLFVGQVLRFSRESAVLRKLRNPEYGKVLDTSFSRLSACPWIRTDGC